MIIIKKLVLWLAVISCICAFGLFIYPTVYKYDKLEQKYPVQINRFTGETKVLTPKGWKGQENVEVEKQTTITPPPSPQRTTGNIYFGNTMQEIRNELGEPTKTQKVNNTPTEVWYYTKLIVRFRDGVVSSISVN